MHYKNFTKPRNLTHSFGAGAAVKLPIP